MKENIIYLKGILELAQRYKQKGIAYVTFEYDALTEFIKVTYTKPEAVGKVYQIGLTDPKEVYMKLVELEL